MWSTLLSLLLATFIASTSAAPSPLSTSANTVTTLSGLGPGHEDGILIHVLRTEDLIADKIPSKPLLLERLSHLLIRVELGNQTVDVNGHVLPILPGSHRPLEINVKLEQVQMLKMPSDSPLMPLRLSAPEVSTIADKYMSEGIVAAMLRVTQEPLEVEAIRDDNVPIQAQAFKVNIAIQILEVDGLSLAQTDLPSVDLIHLIVHPDPSNPTIVDTVTTLIPEALTDHYPSNSDFRPPSPEMIGSLLDMTRASLFSTLESIHKAMQRMASPTPNLFDGHHARKSCHQPPHHHQQQASKPAAVETKDVPQNPVLRISAVNSFGHQMKDIAGMAANSSFATLLLGLPLALVLIAFASALNFVIRRRMASVSPKGVPSSYPALAADKKCSDGEEVVPLMTHVKVVKS